MSIFNSFYNACAFKISARKDEDKKFNYIHYKIIDYDEQKSKYRLQCINTSATFQASLFEILDDDSIIKGLHPVQACYVGLQYADSNRIYPLQKSSLSMDQKRYGRFCIKSQDRNNNICIYDEIKEIEFTMDPRDIALSEPILIGLDAIHSFFIGIFAGLKKDRAPKYLINKPSLYVIK